MLPNLLDSECKLGQYHCWNRVYDIQTGRWTTPDPAASPWSNLQGYVGSNPVSRTDPSGLQVFTGPVPGSRTVWGGMDMTLFNAGNTIDTVLEVHITVNSDLYKKGYRVHHEWSTLTYIECCCGKSYWLGRSAYEILDGYGNPRVIDDHSTPIGSEAHQLCDGNVKRTSMYNFSRYYLARLNAGQLAALGRRGGNYYVDRSGIFEGSRYQPVPLEYADDSSDNNSNDPWHGASPGASGRAGVAGHGGVEDGFNIRYFFSATYECDKSPQPYTSHFDIFIDRFGTATGSGTQHVFGNTRRFEGK